MYPHTNKQWHALFTKPRLEKKVTEVLEKKKIEVYCPMNKLPNRWVDRKKAAVEPLFANMVFVNATPTELAAAKEVDGVVNIVYWLSKPAVIRNEEIETIKRFLTEYDHVSLEATPVNLNDRVRITNGPLMMWEGNVVEIRTNQVKIVLPSLGQSLVAEIKQDKLEKIRPLHEELQMKAV